MGMRPSPCVAARAYADWAAAAAWRRSYDSAADPPPSTESVKAFDSIEHERIVSVRPWRNLRTEHDSYVAALFPGAQALLVVRMLRLLRVFRILKLAHFVRQADDLSQALRASAPKIIVFAITVVTLTTISGSLMYLIEGPEHGFDNIPRGVYWAIVTLTTVGYGDISPATPVGQFVSSLIMIMGYGVIAVPTGIVSAELTRRPAIGGVSGHCCGACGFERHASDALHCARCGEALDR